MTNVIMQNCGSLKSVDEFYDWRAGQEVCSSWTGFQFAYFDPATQKVVAFYYTEHKAEELKRGQRSVVV